MPKSLNDWLAYIEQVHPVGWDPGLERVGRVAEALALTRPAAQTVLVAGTNGKGSTCEYLDQVLRLAGRRVGKTTSPHFNAFNERIQIDGVPVDDAKIIAAFEAIEAARQEMTLSYFEFSALAALLVFSREAVDVAILEIGLGGRLDAFNVVDPDLSIITRIDLDHEAWLGDTRDKIAAEKAGVMRTGQVCLVADHDPPASLATIAAQTGCQLKHFGREFGHDTDSLWCESEGSRVTLPGLALKLPAPSAAVAIQAAVELGVDVGGPDVVPTLAAVTLPGRLQYVAGNPTVLLDVAHNPAAAAYLANHLQSRDRGATPDEKTHAVLGMYADKDIGGVLGQLIPLVDTWHLCSSGEKRSADPAQLADHLASEGTSSQVGCYDKIEHAFSGALAASRDHDLVLVFGSFPVVATVLQMIDQQPLKPA